MDVLRWWFDNALNFAPQLLVVAALLAALGAFEREWVAAVPFAVIAVVLGGWHAGAESLLERPTPCSAASLRLATANVQGRLNAASAL